MLNKISLKSLSFRKPKIPPAPIIPSKKEKETVATLKVPLGSECSTFIISKGTIIDGKITDEHGKRVILAEAPKY